MMAQKSEQREGRGFEGTSFIIGGKNGDLSHWFE